MVRFEPPTPPLGHRWDGSPLPFVRGEVRKRVRVNTPTPDPREKLYKERRRTVTGIGPKGVEGTYRTEEVYVNSTTL